MSQEQRITSNSAFILAIAGAAIGLGNIWRFPYIAGENGGSLFFLLYLLFVVLLGLPVMIAEIVIGRAGRASPVTSFRQLAMTAGGSRHWSKVAWLGTLAATLILSFYSVVSGWILYYLFLSVTGGLKVSSASEASAVFDQLLQSPGYMFLFHSLFIGITIAVSGRSVSRGIERLNNLLMPLMYLILMVLVMYASGFSGFSMAIDYLFAFRPEAVTGGVLLEAMGHAFFTLAIGACCLTAYGAYMPAKQSVVRAVVVVAGLDVLVAVMVGVATFSVVFTENLDAAGGPGLMFITLPVALATMPLGEWVLPLFFLLLVMAVWTSSVNLAEPLVVMTSRLAGSGRRARGALMAGLIVWLAGVIPMLSFNVWKDVAPLPDKSLFDVYTAFATQILLPVTGLLILYFAGYVLERRLLREQLGQTGLQLFVWQWLIRLVSPLLLLLVLFGQLF